MAHASNTSPARRRSIGPQSLLTTGAPYPSEAILQELLPHRPETKIVQASQSLRLEIGPANRPFCKDCIPVDKYSSLYDLMVQQRDHRAEPQPPSPRHLLSRLAHLYPGEFGSMAEEEFVEPWAAGLPGGVIADASALPFKDASVSLIVTKCFPWFFDDPKGITRRRIRQILAEYQRVLTPQGLVLILSDDDPWSPRFRPHSLHSSNLRAMEIPHVMAGIRLGFEAVPLWIHWTRLRPETGWAPKSAARGKSAGGRLLGIGGVALVKNDLGCATPLEERDNIGEEDSETVGNNGSNTDDKPQRLKRTP